MGTIFVIVLERIANPIPENAFVPDNIAVFIAMNSTQITPPLPDLLKSRLVIHHVGGKEISSPFLPEVFQQECYTPLQMTC
ncbi:MAG: hypothetical protein WA364_19630 [Candidatus Nitrosopolaris sp.]